MLTCFFLSESELSESDTENERNFQFEFLIDGIYLHDTLDKHLKSHNITTVSIPQFINHISVTHDVNCFTLLIINFAHNQNSLKIVLSTVVYM